MKLIVNTTNLQSGGALQVALSLLNEWNVRHQQHQYFVFLSPQLAKLIKSNSFSNNFHFYYFDKNPTQNLLTAFTFHRTLSALEKEINADAVFTIFGPALWKPRSKHIVGFANGYYLFDQSDYIRNKVLTNLVQRAKYYGRRFLLFRQLKKEATIFWVETIIAQKRLAQIVTQEIEVIGNTYGTGFKNNEQRKGIPDSSFNLLYLTAYYGHKNIEIIPKVIAALKQRNVACCFLLTLPETVFSNIFSKTDKTYVHNFGPINPADAEQAYQKCDAAFIPSLLETFSAGYPEAMKANKPIITSDLDFAHQVCNDAALYFNPENDQDITSKIESLINDKSLQEQLITKGQQQLSTLETPESRAYKLMQLIEQSPNPHA